MIRVFQRKTKWTPDDDLAFVGDPTLFIPNDRKIPVRVSCAFSWDIHEAERLGRSWSRFFDDVQVGGPALGDPGADFEPGLFLKKGVTITSRGCIRNCPFCFVPKREGKIREYPIHDGWILQDNNILACSKSHQKAVFEMLRRQPKQIDFNGGLDSRLLRPWHVKEFEKMRVRHFWFACDMPDATDPLEVVADLMGGFKQWQKRCYVLIGFAGETAAEAEKRLEAVFNLGFLPFAQLYQGDKKRPWTPEWGKLQRKWCRPAAYKSIVANQALVSDGQTAAPGLIQASLPRASATANGAERLTGFVAPGEFTDARYRNRSHAWEKVMGDREEA